MKKFSAGLFALMIKLGPKLLSVGGKLLKSAKVVKFGLAAGSVAAYTYMFTWQFALALFAALFIHEFGHITAMKKCGLKTKGIYFIPFLGAAAVSDEMFKSREEEAFIALYGPFFGLVNCLILYLIYFISGNAFFGACAGWVALINLFNLLPINPLDGGRVVKSIAFSFNSILGFVFLLIGIAATAVFAFMGNLGLFAFLFVVAILELAFEWRRRNNNPIPSMSKMEIGKYMFFYIALIITLFIIMVIIQKIPEVKVAMELLAA